MGDRAAARERPGAGYGCLNRARDTGRQPVFQPNRSELGTIYRPDPWGLCGRFLSRYSCPSRLAKGQLTVTTLHNRAATATAATAALFFDLRVVGCAQRTQVVEAVFWPQFWRPRPRDDVVDARAR